MSKNYKHDEEIYLKNYDEEIFTFGKFKSMNPKIINDMNYLEWVYRNLDLSDDTTLKFSYKIIDRINQLEVEDY